MKELKTKALTIKLTPSDYALLAKIRLNHKRSISDLIRDAVIFYGVYYSIPQTDLTISEIL